VKSTSVMVALVYEIICLGDFVSFCCASIGFVSCSR